MNLTPPATGNVELDAFLYQLASAVSDSQQSTSVPVPGGYSPSGTLIPYPLRYVHVKFADDNIGTGLTNSPIGKLYYGLFNSSSSTESVTPADYTWALVSGGGMGTTKNFWYRTIGGTYLDYAIASASPGSLFTIDTGAAIDLNINVTAANTLGRVAFAKATTQQLASAPYNFATIGSVTFPTAGTWGFSEVWQGTPPVVSGNEVLFQLDGIFNVSTNVTVWGAPYLAAFKVGQLSAIQADLGAITAGTITLNTTGHIKSGQTAYDTGTGFFVGQSSGVKFSLGNSAGKKLTWDGTTLSIVGELTVGSSPVLSGTTMTGSGAKVYDDGRFVLGKAAQNVTYDGSNLYLNGFSSLSVSSLTTSTLFGPIAATNTNNSSNLALITFVADAARAIFTMQGYLSWVLTGATNYYHLFLSPWLVLRNDTTSTDITVTETASESKVTHFAAGTITTVSSMKFSLNLPALVVGNTYSVRFKAALSCYNIPAYTGAAIMTGANLSATCQVASLRL